MNKIKSMNEFDKAEEKGRKIIENLISEKCVRYEFQPTSSKIDLYVTGFTDIVAIEIKDRENYSSKDIEDLGGMFIMQHKYNSLTATTLSGYRPLFCAIFNDWIYFWDIMDINVTFHDRYLPNTEVINTGKSTQSVACLSIKDAIARYETKNYRTSLKGEYDTDDNT